MKRKDQAPFAGKTILHRCFFPFLFNRKAFLKSISNWMTGITIAGFLKTPGFAATDLFPGIEDNVIS